MVQGLELCGPRLLGLIRASCLSADHFDSGRNTESMTWYAPAQLLGEIVAAVRVLDDEIAFASK